MTATEKIIADALRLPVSDRHRVLREIIISLDGHEEDVSAAWASEIDDRVSEILDGRVEMLDGAKVHDLLRERLRAKRL